MTVPFTPRAPNYDNVIDARAKFRAGPRGIATTMDAAQHLALAATAFERRCAEIDAEADAMRARQASNSAAYFARRDQEAGDGPEAA